MTDYAQSAQTLTLWYTHRARPFVLEVAADRVEQLDQEFRRLEPLRALSKATLPICFLGTAGVGKSTLINALVAGRDVILPAGGVGPLTAEATTVKFADERQFVVEYQPPGKLNRLLFVLERAYEQEAAAQSQGATPPDQGILDSLSREDREELELGVSAHGLMDTTQPTDLATALVRQATHLVRGEQYAVLDRPYLLDRLRDCLGAANRWGTTAAAEDTPRIEKVRAVLERARQQSPFSFSATGAELSFRTELEQHAAGHLAPLVRTLQVGWDTDVLRSGVVLVDLPGVGVANDQFRKVTAQWIRQARAVVLVVDRAGMTDASAELLRASGFLSSLLHDSGDPEDLNTTLLVAVVKLDATADDARTKERLLHPTAVRPWIVHFDEACERAQAMLREQLGVELQKVSDLGGESTRDERLVVVDRVLQGLQIHPVVAPQYRKLLIGDEEDPPRIKTPEQSRVPALSFALNQLVRDRNGRVDARIEFLLRNLSDRVRGLLELARAKAEQEGAVKHERAEWIRREAEKQAEPLRREIINKQGEFREFLRSTVPKEIEARVDAAAADARADIIKHLVKYRSYHWGTLRAAIRRGGAYDGSKKVDIPSDLAMLFEDPVAIVWSKFILSGLRGRTQAMGTEYVGIVGEFVEWGRRQGTDLDPRVLEAAHRELQAQMSGLGTIGREAIDELRQAVKRELYGKVESEIRKRCQQFVQEGGDSGRGVKDRMLDLLAELGDIAVDAAKPIARHVLRAEYSRVEAEIRLTFDKYQNPIDSALRDVLGETGRGKHAKTAQQQLEIAKRAKGLLADMPLPAAQGRGEAAA